MNPKQPPVWLLDIDGVVNACGRNLPDTWPGDCWLRAEVNGFPISVAVPVIEYITEIHESGAAEIRWHTTWQYKAQMLADEFGLPTFPIADAPEYLGWVGPTRGEWWKTPAAERVLADEGRDLIWTDDDIIYGMTKKDRKRLHDIGHALMITPRTTCGLEPFHFELINHFIEGSPADVYPSPVDVPGDLSD